MAKGHNYKNDQKYFRHYHCRLTALISRHDFCHAFVIFGNAISQSASKYSTKRSPQYLHFHILFFGGSQFAAATFYT